MRRVAGFALSAAAGFLTLVAILIDAPALFYMSFSLFALILACNLQSTISARALRIVRIAPKSVRIGELVTVELEIWSERKIKRPLVTVQDRLPGRLGALDVSPSLPIAPAFDLPVRTMYQFRPQKRGRFTWRNIEVLSTDALGLTTKRVTYQTEPTEVLVVPNPIALGIELPTSAGWGINEAQSGQAAGAGLEPRGVRPYQSGDSLRHVHWRSSARTGELQVKEFQAGSFGTCAFVIQRAAGTDVGRGAVSTLDVMCGNVLYLCEEMRRQGVNIYLPNVLEKPNEPAPERLEDVAIALGGVMADSPFSVGVEMEDAMPHLPSGTTVYCLACVDDGSITSAVRVLSQRFRVIVLAYSAKAYDEKFMGRDAADPSFLQAVRQAGGEAYVVPEFHG